MSAPMLIMVALIGVLLLVVIALSTGYGNCGRWAGPRRSCATFPPSAVTAGDTV